MVLGNHELYFIKGTQIDDEMGESEIKHQEWVKSKITEELLNYEYPDRNLIANWFFGLDL